MICALSTPNGIGAIGVVRVSGKGCIKVVSSIFSKTLIGKRSHTLHFGTIYAKDETPIDEVLVSVFTDEKSFTGEQSVEISAHGSPYILQAILNVLLDSGIRMATPGEFTMRAFLNGKIDLSQAEAVADLIESESTRAHQIAINQLKGKFSSQLQQLREQLINFASLLELEIDFSEEDVQFADRTQLIELLENVLVVIIRLEESFQLGNAIKNGIPVAIVGEPNVGKSTLLNQLLQDERAIVSSIAGTTRDVIEEQLNIEGIIFRLIDTAGIRNNVKEEIEALGIQRSKQKIEQASIVLCVADATKENSIQQVRSWKQELTKKYPLKKIIVIINKTDQYLPEILQNEIDISAKKGTNIEKIKQYLVKQTIDNNELQNDIIISNVRHRDALTQTRISLLQAKNGLQTNITSDFVALDIRQAMYYLGTITGEISEDDLLENIFSKFCIGK